MTREEFIKVLDGKGYLYRIEVNKIVVISDYDYRDIRLNSLPSIYSGVVFNNDGNVYLGKLSNIPSGVVFNNGGYVYLREIKSIDRGVEFNNVGSVFKGEESFVPIMGEPYFSWKGEIEGINNRRLLNLMIKQGVFER